MRTLRAWAPLVVVCVVALWRAAAAKAPEAPPPASDADKHAAFASIAAQEPEMRKTAAKDFPTDRWSQDDDFHAQELARASSFARGRRVRLGDVLEAIDDGMRERWTPAADAMIATVPPCQPRTIY